MNEFFKWAKAHGYSMEDIKTMLGYRSVSTVYTHRRGEYKDTTNFKIRAVHAFGEPVRRIFFGNGIGRPDR